MDVFEKMSNEDLVESFRITKRLSKDSDVHRLIGDTEKFRVLAEMYQVELKRRNLQVIYESKSPPRRRRRIENKDKSPPPPPVAVNEEDMDDPNFLQKQTDEQLIIAYKSIVCVLEIKSSDLVDGGKALLPLLEKTKAEFYRRKLKVPHEPVLTGRLSDLRPRGTTPSVSRPQSTRGAHFCPTCGKKWDTS